MEQYNYFNLKAVLLYIRPTCFKLFNTLWQDDGKKNFSSIKPLYLSLDVCTIFINIQH